ncbi:MAG: amidohydrolase family protein [Patescibacteria group bacterium]
MKKILSYFNFKFSNKTMGQNNFQKIKEKIGRGGIKLDNDEHSRIRVAKKDYRRVLIHNAPYIFTCDENDKLRARENYSLIIEDGIIKTVAPSAEIQPDEKDFDLVYDAGLRGGIVITPGLINAHAHPPMYLLRSAMMLDEGEAVDQTIAAMPAWERAMTDEDNLVSAIGDLTEEQKYGITRTLSHHAVFEANEEAAKITGHNLINAVSAASNTHPENSPALIEKLVKDKDGHSSQIAIAVHYLHKAKPEILKEIKKLVDKHNLLFTCHLAESENVARECKKIHGKSEVDVLEKYGLLNDKTIVSHAIYLSKKEIRKLADAKVGIVHLPTSNTIHKSGTFPLWQYYDAGAQYRIALGTDSVVSKSQLDLLSEAYQTRLTHLYSRTVKFGSLFKMMTINAARIMHLPNAGKIMPGFEADLAFWKLKDRGCIPYDKDNPVSLIGNIITHNSRTVRDLMINGRFVIKERRHLLVNESKLLELLQEKHMEMRKRVKNG